MGPRVSVVVVSKDEPALRGTLEVLRPQCDSVEGECVVVDASSGRLEEIRRAHPWVRWEEFHAEGTPGVTIAHQRNAGISAARSDVIAFCDAGGTPPDGWLVALTAPLLDGRSQAATGPIEPSRRGAYGVLNDYADGSWTDHVITANFAVTKGAIAAIGGFDERYAYGSDAGLGWRLADKGIQVLVVRDARLAIDWGDARRERARALRQGHAWALHLRLDPAHRVRAARAAPYTLCYGVALLVAGAAMALALRWRRGAVALLGLAPLAALVASGRPRDARLRVATYHVLHGAGAAAEVVRNRLSPDGP